MSDPDSAMKAPDAMVKRPVATMSFMSSAMRLMSALVKHRNANSASIRPTVPGPMCVTRA